MLHRWTPTIGKRVRFRLYDAIVATLSLAAADHRVVVILDDLHWTDVASLALTEFVAARIAAARVLLVATYRPGATPRFLSVARAEWRPRGSGRFALSALGSRRTGFALATTVGGGFAIRQA